MNFKIIEGPESIQGSDAWLAYRQSRIMATDAAVLLGRSPWKTLLQLFNEKSFGVQDRVATPAMQRGKDLEPCILARVNAQFGPPYFSPVVVESTIHDGLGASLDGLRFDNELPEVLEIKCPGERDHLSAISGIVPPHYLPQLDHIMIVLDVKYCWYVSFYDGAIVKLLVHADEKRQKELLAKEASFLAILRSQTPPEPSDRDAIEIFDPEAEEMAKKYLELTDEIMILEKHRDLIKKQLSEYCESSKTQIGPVTLSRIERLGSIDYLSIPELSKVDLEKYRKPTTHYIKISSRGES